MTSSGRSISASGSRRCRDRLHVLCWRYRGGIIGRIVSRRSRVAGASGSLRGPSPFTRLLPAPPGAAPRRPSPSRGAQPQSQRRQRAMRSARACARASPRLAECARRNQRAGRSERGPHSRVAARAAPAAIRKRVSEKRKNLPRERAPAPVRRGERKPLVRRRRNLARYRFEAVPSLSLLSPPYLDLSLSRDPVHCESSYSAARPRAARRRRAAVRRERRRAHVAG